MPVSWLPGAIRSALRWGLPDWGQAGARHNAWSSMVQDNQRRAQRVEAELALQAANARAESRHIAVG
jgi:hypothetical protein